MNEIKHIFGSGGMKLSIPGIYQQTFPTAMCTLYFERIDNKNSSITGKFIPASSQYYRSVIQVQLFELNSQDDNYYAALIFFINNLSSYDLYLTPNYDQSQTFYNSYDNTYCVYLDGSVSFTQMYDRNIGQTIKLKFVSRDLITTLPTNYSFGDTIYMIDNNDDNIVDSSGNCITIIL